MRAFDDGVSIQFQVERHSREEVCRLTPENSGLRFGAMETLDVAYANARPKASDADAERLAAAYWNRYTTARELPSERDQVFELTTASGELTFLKVSNALEP